MHLCRLAAGKIGVEYVEDIYRNISESKQFILLVLTIQIHYHARSTKHCDKVTSTQLGPLDKTQNFT
jgi:hypothetical protein